MRITNLNLHNIGVFEDETIEFKPCPTKGKAEIHIFTGTNGTGKSTILKGIAAAFSDAGLTTKGEVACSKDINSFTKYLRQKNIDSSGTVTFENNSKDSIKYYGCDEGARHLHLSKNDSEVIKDYRTALGRQGVLDFGFSFEFALFAYSGTRLLNIVPDDMTSLFSNKNPLFETLEFNKQFNYAYALDLWIKNALLKRSYAKTEGLAKKEHNFKDTIQRLETAISEIVGNDVKFKLDNDIRSPLIIVNKKEQELDVLPDGLKSILSWLADMCMRLEELNWKDDISVFDRNVILFLDEIEVHLHIEWQRKILPVIQKLLPNAQIFISTHSPFVVNSVDDAWVYNLVLDEAGNAKVRKIELSQDAKSISFVLRDIFNVKANFGWQVEKDLQEFYMLRDQALALKISQKDTKKLSILATSLSNQSAELENLVGFDMQQIEKQKQRQKLK